MRLERDVRRPPDNFEAVPPHDVPLLTGLVPHHADRASHDVLCEGAGEHQHASIYLRGAAGRTKITAHGHSSSRPGVRQTSGAAFLEPRATCGSWVTVACRVVAVLT
ncbi:hypothetical protein FA95DRAFT_1357535 [Auriscalpium vulgare]|uniref:Uncharacterized protein n=1 Tax=Auriscalpium vulgare TaxID=40419 RepID=A0ACB8R155_9AGAM|nr:hypothetical protein FA95DRAFT_1357535 [Auriscalpium vulgare]